MIRGSIRRLFIVGGFLIMLWFPSSAVAQHGETGIDMPFQLANGHIRTPAFKVKGRPYLVDLFVKTDIPFEEWCCVIKADKTPNFIPECHSEPDHRIHASWTLWEGVYLVAQGPSEKLHSECNRGWMGERGLQLGGFQVKKGKTYVLDVEFTNVDPNLPITGARIKVWPAPDMWP
jgi:hypothetical protein